jgi:hypothetical protein
MIGNEKNSQLQNYRSFLTTITSVKVILDPKLFEKLVLNHLYMNVSQEFTIRGYRWNMRKHRKQQGVLKIVFALASISFHHFYVCLIAYHVHFHFTALENTHKV